MYKPGAFTEITVLLFGGIGQVCVHVILPGPDFGVGFTRLGFSTKMVRLKYNIQWIFLWSTLCFLYNRRRLTLRFNRNWNNIDTSTNRSSGGAIVNTNEVLSALKSDKWFILFAQLSLHSCCCCCHCFWPKGMPPTLYLFIISNPNPRILRTIFLSTNFGGCFLVSALSFLNSIFTTVKSWHWTGQIIAVVFHEAFFFYSMSISYCVHFLGWNWTDNCCSSWGCWEFH